MKIRSDLDSRTTPQTSPLRASDGESFVSYTMKNDRDISRAHCIIQAQLSTGSAPLILLCVFKILLHNSTCMQRGSFAIIEFWTIIYRFKKTVQNSMINGITLTSPNLNNIWRLLGCEVALVESEKYAARRPRGSCTYWFYCSHKDFVFWGHLGRKKWPQKCLQFYSLGIVCNYRIDTKLQFYKSFVHTYQSTLVAE